MVEYYSTVYSYSVRLGTSYEIMHSKARSSVLYGVISPAIWENVFFTDMQYLYHEMILRLTSFQNNFWPRVSYLKFSAKRLKSFTVIQEEVIGENVRTRCYNTHKQYINSKDVEKSVQCCSCAGIDPNCASRVVRFETLI